jgi:hypothetical protein
MTLDFILEMIKDVAGGALVLLAVLLLVVFVYMVWTTPVSTKSKPEGDNEFDGPAKN